MLYACLPNSQTWTFLSADFFSFFSFYFFYPREWVITRPRRENLAKGIFSTVPICQIPWWSKETAYNRAKGAKVLCSKNTWLWAMQNSVVREVRARNTFEDQSSACLFAITWTVVPLLQDFRQLFAEALRKSCSSVLEGYFTILHVRKAG